MRRNQQPTRRPLPFAGLLLLLVLAGALRVGAAPEMEEPVAWGSIASPLLEPGESLFYDMDGLTDSEFWAVGSTGESGLAAQYSNGEWVNIEPLEADDPLVLEGVAVGEDGTVWAVGRVDEELAGHQPVIFRRENGLWVEYPFSLSAGETGRLTDVLWLAPDDAWAVGRLYTSVGTILLHWNGLLWEHAEHGCQNGGFDQIEAVPSGGLWAVGDSVCHYSNGQWEDVYIGTPPTQLEWRYMAVDGTAANNIWIVGAETGCAVNCHTNAIVWQWNGTVWTNRTAGAMGFHHPYDVHVLASDDVYVVGEANRMPFIGHWDGTGWRYIPSATPTWQGYFYALHTVTGEKLWTAGSFKDSGVATRTLVAEAPSQQYGSVRGEIYPHMRVSWTGPVNGSHTIVWTLWYGAADLPPGDYTFTASVSGCQTVTVAVAVRVGETTRQDFPCLPLPTATPTLTPSVTLTPSSTAIPSTTPTASSTATPSATPTATTTPMPNTLHLPLVGRDGYRSEVPTSSLTIGDTSGQADIFVWERAR